jgi:hypothetical protein
MCALQSSTVIVVTQARLDRLLGVLHCFYDGMALHFLNFESGGFSSPRNLRIASKAKRLDSSAAFAAAFAASFAAAFGLAASLRLLDWLARRRLDSFLDRDRLA